MNFPVTVPHDPTPDICDTNEITMPDIQSEEPISSYWGELSNNPSTETSSSQRRGDMASSSDTNTALIDEHIPTITTGAQLQRISTRIQKPKQYPDYIVYGLSKDKGTDKACLWRGDLKGEVPVDLSRLEVWTLKPLPAGAKVIGNKWVFKKKENADGATLFRARLVAKGFTQTQGLDYHETFAPVVRGSTLRILFATAATFDLKIGHIDIKTAFLYGDLQETVYMAQPEALLKIFVWR